MLVEQRRAQSRRQGGADAAGRAGAVGSLDGGRRDGAAHLRHQLHHKVRHVQAPIALVTAADPSASRSPITVLGGGAPHSYDSGGNGRGCHSRHNDDDDDGRDDEELFWEVVGVGRGAGGVSGRGRQGEGWSGTHHSTSGGMLVQHTTTSTWWRPSSSSHESLGVNNPLVSRYVITGL